MKTTSNLTPKTVFFPISIPDGKAAQPSKPARPLLVAKWTRIEGKMTCQWVKE